MANNRLRREAISDKIPALAKKEFKILEAIEKAKEIIKQEEYKLELIEEFKRGGFEGYAPEVILVKFYLISTAKDTADLLNELGHKISNRKYLPTDITRIIDNIDNFSKVPNYLKKEVKSVRLKNQGRTRSWGKYE